MTTHKLSLLHVGFVPAIHYSGSEQVSKHNLHVVIMDLLDKCLEEIFCQCRRSFDLKTVLLIANQLLKKFQTLHERRIIHRDVKPQNFLMGATEQTKDTIYIIDFGLARKVINNKGTHIPYRDGKNLAGTARYVSIATHRGVE